MNSIVRQNLSVGVSTVLAMKLAKGLRAALDNTNSAK
jgi:hypothetical protein